MARMTRSVFLLMCTPRASVFPRLSVNSLVALLEITTEYAECKEVSRAIFLKRELHFEDSER